MAGNLGDQEVPEHVGAMGKSTTFLTEHGDDDTEIDTDRAQEALEGLTADVPTRGSPTNKLMNGRPDSAKSGQSGKSANGVLKFDEVNGPPAQPKSTMSDNNIRKAVRFAEEPPCTPPDRRAKSAVARLAAENVTSEEMVKKPRASTGVYRSSSYNGNKEDCNSNNNNNEGDEENCNNNSNKNGEDNKGAGKGQRLSRAKYAWNATEKVKNDSKNGSRRVTFSDPQPDALNLSVLGKKTSSDVKPGAPYLPLATGPARKTKAPKAKIVGSRSRPQSAKSPNKFTVERVRDFLRRRPLSAQCSTSWSLDEDVDFTIRPDSSIDTESSSQAAGRHSRLTRHKRPVSGICLATTPRTSVEVERHEESDPDDVGLAVLGNRMGQSLKTGICTQCSKPTNKIAVYSESMGVLVCDVCNRGNHAKIRKYKKLAAQHQTSKDERVGALFPDEDFEGDLVPDEVITDDVELDAMLEDLERERDAKRDEERKAKVMRGSRQSRRPNPNEGLFDKMAELQKSINEVTAEIKDSMSTAINRGIDPDEGMFPSSFHEVPTSVEEISSDPVVVPPEEPEISKDEERRVELSQYLTHLPHKPETYDMKVYHYWQGAKKYGHTVVTAGGDKKKPLNQQEEFENDPDITTYQVCNRVSPSPAPFLFISSLQWCHNGHGSVSNHQPHDCFLNHLFRHRSKKTSKLRVTGLCAGNSLEASEFPAQMASNVTRKMFPFDDFIMWYSVKFYNSFEDPAPMDFIYGSPILKGVAVFKVRAPG